MTIDDDDEHNINLHLSPGSHSPIPSPISTINMTGAAVADSPYAYEQTMSVFVD